MRSLSLMILDSNDEFRLALQDALPSTYRLYPAPNGLEALNTAKRIRPDLIVMDLMLTGLDGITFLQELQAAGVNPTVMLVTRLNNAYVTDWVDQLGISYVMLKPCDPAAVVKRLDDLSHRIQWKDNPLPDLDTYISAQLTRMSFHPKYRGYGLLKDSILELVDNPNMAITKELYPLVGAKNHVSPTMVERAIRNAIANAWHQGDKNIWAEYFPVQADGTIARPSNGFFVTTLADEIRSIFRKAE